MYHRSVSFNGYTLLLIDRIFSLLAALCMYNIIIVHSFYKALFSAVEHTHCTHVACDFERVTILL